MNSFDRLPEKFTEEKLWRVLVVDDHDDMLSLMRIAMTRRSFHVETANCGTRALEVARDFAPHLVISDISMPGMNGYEMMAALRELENTLEKLTPFKSIALTGFDAEEEREASQKAGFDAQMTKPIDFDSLFDMIDELLVSPTENPPPGA